MDTKEKILLSALELFADRGYEAVTVAQIAEAVGIKAPSLYKHYQSKQAIFDAILQKMDTQYLQQVAALSMHGKDPDRDSHIFACLSGGNLAEMVLSLFHYFLHDPFVSRFRRLLTVEQFHQSELSRLNSRQYAEDPIAYQTELFRQLIAAGCIRPLEPGLLAMEFYSPIYFLLQLCDREPLKEPEALELLRRHVENFQLQYGILKEERQ